MRKLSVFGCTAAVSAAAGIFTVSCHSVRAEKESAPPPSAPVTHVIRGPLARTFRVAGQFIPYQEVDLHAKVSGYIRRIMVDIGDRVHVGQTLAVLEVPELEAQVAGASAQVRHTQSEIARAESEVTRAQSNHDAVHSAYVRLKEAGTQRPGLIAQQELDDARARDENAEAQIVAAQSAVEATKQQLGVSEADRLRVQTLSNYSSVLAPFNGVVVKRYADTGALIQAGTASNTQALPVVRIAQSDVLRLRMPVPESDVSYIRPGSTVQIAVSALHYKRTGTIVRFSRDLDPTTHTMVAEVDVPNPDLSISPGMYAETEIILERESAVLSVPSQAIVGDSGSAYVLSVDSTNHVQKHPVKLGIEGENRVEIRSGLTEGDAVILSGQNNYQAGELVRPELSPAPVSKEGN